MSVNSLLNVPQTQEDWDRWSFSHAQDHLRIIQAIQSQANINLNQYQLDPINFKDVKGWEFRHLQTHIDMDAVLKIQSTDLSGLDLQDPQKLQEFISSNYQEHNNAHLVLGI